MKLGRLPHDLDAFAAGALRLPLYQTPGVVLPRPASCEYGAGIDFPAWGNLTAGDCTYAAFAALLVGWTQASKGFPILLQEEEVLEAYAALTGYRADDPSTDLGAAEPDVLRTLVETGIGGYRIDAFASVTGFSLDGFALLQSAIYLFGGVSLDLALPLVAKDQVEAGYLYLDGEGLADAAAPGSWGLHEAAALGYGPAGVYLRTWGRRLIASWPWVAKYSTGAWALQSTAFLDATGRAANGIDLEAWKRDFAVIGHR